MDKGCLGITAFWNPDRDQNVFGIRGSGERCAALYKWLNGGKCSARFTSSDWPWDYVVFDDPYDEQSFLVYYEDTITFDKEPGYEYRPLPPNLKPKGWVPHDQRVPGQSYKEPCGHHHVWNPIKPGDKPLEDQLMEILGAAIAAEIDREILEELRNAHSIPTRR